MASICLRYTRNQEDAIEVLHNGFLKVYKNMHTYDATKASLYTWIRTIIVNSAIDVPRRGLQYTGVLTIIVNSAIDFIRQRGKFKNNIELERAEEPAIEADA